MFIAIKVMKEKSVEKVDQEQEVMSTKETMRLIYQNNLWGGGKQDFYSGQGSHKQKIVEPYIQVVSDWLDSFDQQLSICDLGCGDFNVGRQLVGHSKSYVGIDVVKELIQRNIRLFQTKNVTFQCLDMVREELPKADCAIVRQVFQHLSNHEILTVLSKLKEYRFLVLTEHLPVGEFIPNIDKPTDFDIRLGKKSGVVLTCAPFGLKPIKQGEMLSIDFRNRSKIVTTLYQNF